MKITTIELENDIDEEIRIKCKEFYEQYMTQPVFLVISTPLYNWLRKVMLDKSRGYWQIQLNFDLDLFEGLKIIKTRKDNIIEVY